MRAKDQLCVRRPSVAMNDDVSSLNIFEFTVGHDPITMISTEREGSEATEVGHDVETTKSPFC